MEDFLSQYWMFQHSISELLRFGIKSCGLAALLIGLDRARFEFTSKPPPFLDTGLTAGLTAALLAFGFGFLLRSFVRYALVPVALSLLITRILRKVAQEKSFTRQRTRDVGGS